LKNKGRVYACLYIAGVILLFIFAVVITIEQTAIPVHQPDGPVTTITQQHAWSTPTPSLTPSIPLTTTPTIILVDEPVLFLELAYREFGTIEGIDTFISDVDKAIELLLNECATVDKYTAIATTAMNEEVDRLITERALAADQKAHMLLWAEKEIKYPYATRVWKYIKGLGYSDVACAGILGNLMAECGGLTLELQPLIYDTAGEYYGMFQWSLYYYPEADGMSFEEQLEYYKQTSIPTFKTCGNNYASGFTLDDFNQLTDPREAALAFAKIYERCASWTYGIRKDCAEAAYQYFVLDFKGI
jgi:hypothetical protein